MALALSLLTLPNKCSIMGATLPVDLQGGIAMGEEEIKAEIIGLIRKCKSRKILLIIKGFVEKIV